MSLDFVGSCMSFILKLWAGVIVFSSSALAFEHVNMRSLQDGPVGDGVSFGPLRNSEAEFSYQGRNYVGRADTEDLRLTGSRIEHTIKAAMGYTLNPSMRFISFATYRMSDVDYIEEVKNEYSYKAQSMDLEFGAGPAMVIEQLVLGGSVSVLYMDEEIQETSLGEESARKVLPSVFVPFMRMYAGIKSPVLQMVAGVRIFNRSKVDITVEDAQGEAQIYSGRRFREGEVWFDGRLKVLDNLYFATGLTLRKKNQAAENISDEVLGLDLSPVESEYANLNRNTDELEVMFGGTYKANSHFSLSSSLGYTSPSYSEEDYASPIYENLGGYFINVGSSIEFLNGSLNFKAGYLVSNATEYEVIDIQGTPWANVGDTVSIEQPEWDFSAGFSVAM